VQIPAIPYNLLPLAKYADNRNNPMINVTFIVHMTILAAHQNKLRIIKFTMNATSTKPPKPIVKSMYRNFQSIT
jgi:hypothetical protein